MEREVVALMGGEAKVEEPQVTAYNQTSRYSHLRPGEAGVGTHVCVCGGGGSGLMHPSGGQLVPGEGVEGAEQAQFLPSAQSESLLLGNC